MILEHLAKYVRRTTQKAEDLCFTHRPIDHARSVHQTLNSGVYRSKDAQLVVINLHTLLG
jgi:hypothetical protein